MTKGTEVTMTVKEHRGDSLEKMVAESKKITELRIG